MSRADRIAQRQRELRAHLGELDRELAELRSMRARQHDDDEHDPDGVSLSSEWSRLEGLRQAQRDALAAIEDAAARLEHGDDGICASCGRPIALERLEARPDATTCIDCAR